MTKIYGASDDLIEFDGDVSGEVGCYNRPALVICSDGTILEIKYGKADLAIWGITALKEGALFDRMELCTNENDNPNSDVAFFKSGLTWAYAATEWQRVR